MVQLTETRSRAGYMVATLELGEFVEFRSLELILEQLGDVLDIAHWVADSDITLGRELKVRSLRYGSPLEIIILTAAVATPIVAALKVLGMTFRDFTQGYKNISEGRKLSAERMAILRESIEANPALDLDVEMFIAELEEYASHLPLRDARIAGTLFANFRRARLGSSNVGSAMAGLDPKSEKMINKHLARRGGDQAKALNKLVLRGLSITVHDDRVDEP